MPFRNMIMLASAAVVLAASTPAARADSFSAVVVYGDSLSDNGNLYATTKKYLGVGSPTSPPYYMGRFSNGPVAVEQLASKLGSPLVDFAYGGATSGVGNVGDGGTTTTPGLLPLPGVQIEFKGSQAALTPGLLATGLFVVWGGANDFSAGGTAAAGAANIDAIVATLISGGAQHVIVPGVPDLEDTPEDAGNAASRQFALDFNKALQAGLPKGATYVDTYSLLDGLVANPSLYGFTNVTDPCFNGVTVCANPDQYLFWDDFHPTTKAAGVVTNAFLAAATTVPVQTPEPSSWMLLGSGMAGLGAVVRRARAKLAV